MSHSAFLPRWARPRMLGVVVLLTALMSVGSAVAQQAAPVQSYDVELLIFRNLSGKETPENWGVEAAGAAQRLDIPEDELSSSVLADVPTVAAPTVTFPALPASKMKLTAIEDTMRRSRSYQPVAHIGWTQPGYARNAAKFLSVSSLVSGSSGLQGQIALSRGRYLHLTLDLVLDGAASGDGQRYVLRQTRRMRSNERHYIDSPKLGVIAVITPSSGTDAN
ncbi:MAG TPA: CsiV family protein [Steroidobacter sp.]|uniref:CsiV family protein n=1 Tax=Steroidobacter sp. TaxID=1978227 RepID=UPI002ED7D60B